MYHRLLSNCVLEPSDVLPLLTEHWVTGLWHTWLSGEAILLKHLIKFVKKYKLLYSF